MIVDTNTDFDFSTIIDTAKWDWTRVSIPYHLDTDRTVIMTEIVDYLTENYGEINQGWNYEDLPDNASWERVKQFYVGTRKAFTIGRGREHVGNFIQIEATGSMDNILARKVIDRIARIKRPDTEKKGLNYHPFEVRGTRSDSCIDLCGDSELFNTLTGFFNAFCTERKISCVPDGRGWHDPSFSRTMYYGSRNSDFYMRIYEKGFEQKEKGVKDADLTWVRIEVEVKFKKPLQRLAVGKWTSPSLAFQLGWIKKAFSDLLVSDILGASVPTSYKPITDTEKTILNMFKRSRKALKLLAMQSPSKADFIDTILKEIEYDFEK